MPKLIAAGASFNGVLGTCTVAVDSNSFSSLLLIAGLSLWDRFDGETYWQSNFDSPIYRRPSPLSKAEGEGWLNVWRKIASGELADDGSCHIPSANGSTAIEWSDKFLRATTDGGNVTEYRLPGDISEGNADLRPQEPGRIDCTIDYDLTIGSPRARIRAAGKDFYALLDTGCDHSMFDVSLASDIFQPEFKVGGAGGSRSFKIGTVKDVEIGGVSIGDVTPFLDTFSRMPGPFRMMKAIIGQDILGRGVLHLDHERNQFVIAKTSNKPLTCPLDGSLAPAVLDGEEGWYCIDTGSPGALDKFRAPSPDTNSAHSIQGPMGSLRAKPAKWKELHIDQARLINFPSRAVAQESNGTAGIIGMGLLQKMNVTLDFADGLAAFA